jgi:hypothetical protein
VRRWIALATVASLFVVGVVVGALGMHLYYAQRLGRPGAPPGMIARSFEDRLQRELRLSPEQMSQMHAILEEGHAERERIHAELAPRVHEHMERIHRRILQEVLTPEQRVRFEELHAAHPRRADAFVLHPPGATPRHPH